MESPPQITQERYVDISVRYNLKSDVNEYRGRKRSSGHCFNIKSSKMKGEKNQAVYKQLGLLLMYLGALGLR